MKKREFTPIQAISLGIFIDIFGTLLLQIVVSGIALSILKQQGLTESEIATFLSNSDTFFAKSISLVGLGISAVAGYICARTINRNEYLYVGIMAGIMALFSTATAYKFVVPTYLLYMIASNATVTLFGAYLYVSKKQNIVNKED